METINFQIRKLEKEEDFKKWKFQVQIMLRARNVYDKVEQESDTSRCGWCGEAAEGPGVMGIERGAVDGVFGGAVEGVVGEAVEGVLGGAVEGVIGGAVEGVVGGTVNTVVGQAEEGGTKVVEEHDSMLSITC
ncbi:hypothetical protein M8J77_009961 [Diaphorina citri]|nr:hypothetical protein M8J77_009961 [Diaphorina citri]